MSKPKAKSRTVRLRDDVFERAHAYAGGDDPISDAEAVTVAVMSTDSESLGRIADAFSIRTSAKVIEALTLARPDGVVLHTSEGRWRFRVNVPGTVLDIDCGTGEPTAVKRLLRQAGIGLDAAMLPELLDPEVSE